VQTKVTNQSGVQVLQVDGDLVVATCNLFREAVMPLLERDARDYVVDLSKTRGVDSAGLESLTWLRRTCEERLGEVKLAAPSETVRTVLRLTRLDERFEVHENHEAAVASFT
jgi:anti-sigma B factor antagonist